MDYWLKILSSKLMLTKSNAVRLAKLLYPVEAGVAMVNAHVDGTSEFSLAKALDVPPGNHGPAMLNDIPFLVQEEHLSRMRALSKTGTCVYILLLLCHPLILLNEFLRTYEECFLSFCDEEMSEKSW